MQAEKENTAELIKQTIRSVQTETEPAAQEDVFNKLRQNTKRPTDSVKETYEWLRETGEIYTYPNGGVVVVKITDEVL